MKITIYANDTIGNLKSVEITIEKDTSGDGNGEQDLIIIIIVILIAICIGAAIAVIGLRVTKKSKQELKKREAEIENLRKQRESITEDDILVSKEEHICLVHKGPIKGYSFICPECGTYYCQRCVDAIKKTENICWSCQTPIDPSKSSKKSKGRKEKIQAIVEEDEIEFVKEPNMKIADKSISPKTSITPQLKSDIIQKKSPKLETLTKEEEMLLKKVIPKHVILSEKEPISTPPAPLEELTPDIQHQIREGEKTVKELELMAYKLEIKFKAGAISQEDYLEQKNNISRKMEEVMSDLDKLKEK